MEPEYLRTMRTYLGGSAPGDLGVCPEKTTTLILERPSLIRKYSFAIPDHKALLAIKECGPIVEVGAGSGYWARELHDIGVDIVAYDAKEERWGWECSWFPVTKARGQDVVAQHSDRAMFLCWPSYSETWAYETLKAYVEGGGRTVIYVGEGSYGCCADEDFFQYLDGVQQLDTAKEYHLIPTHYGINDHLCITRVKDPS